MEILLLFTSALFQAALKAIKLKAENGSFLGARLPGRFAGRVRAIAEMKHTGA